VAVPVQSAALEDTSVHLIARLGRHLTPAPLRLLNILMSYLNGYERCLERSRLSQADGSESAQQRPVRAQTS
jgi:hypothetical protein